MQFTSIEDCLEWIKTGGSYSNAVNDVCSAYRESKAHLEFLFDSKLFMREDYGFEDAKDQQYFDELSRIEDLLVRNNLIYNG
jgi:hypothetical protein